jgi:hypothetical protein
MRLQYFMVKRDKSLTKIVNGYIEAYDTLKLLCEHIMEMNKKGKSLWRGIVINTNDKRRLRQSENMTEFWKI